MVILISPAKSLDFESDHPEIETTLPSYLDQSEKLINALRKKSVKKLGNLMSISENLAQLNAERYGKWNLPFNEENARAAVFAFDGDVYQGLDAGSLKKPELNYLQKNLRILSGLYGVLKPFDLIQPYRLEMGTKLTLGRKKNLYQFWGETIADRISDENQDDIIVNLASNEYGKAALTKKFVQRSTVVTPQFLDAKNGDYKMISFFAKKARGLMARYMAQNRVTDIESLKRFNLEGYVYNPRLSEAKENWIFTRD